MTYLAIMKWNADNRVAKYEEFATAAKASVHASNFYNKYPDAFWCENPGAGAGSWLVDPVNKTLSISIPPVVKPTKISYEAFQERFTVAERTATTEFVREIDAATLKPKRPGLDEALMRAVSKGTVDLLESRTDTFLSALVAGGVISAARKLEILTP